MAGAMAIPVSEIESYCRLLEIGDADWREMLMGWIQFLDNVYLEHVAEKQKAAAAKKPKK